MTERIPAYNLRSMMVIEQRWCDVQTGGFPEVGVDVLVWIEDDPLELIVIGSLVECVVAEGGREFRASVDERGLDLRVAPVTGEADARARGVSRQ